MKSTLKNMAISLTGIAAIMGAVLAGVHQLTIKPIEQAELKAKTDALASVLPEFDNDPLATAKEIQTPNTALPSTIYTATKGDDLTGYAIESSTMDGFSGEIKVVVGFDRDGKITGYEVLQHAETPGLGAKAGEWFKSDIGHRSVIGTADYLKVAKDGGTIDGITAATITSRAFLDALNTARDAFNQTTK